MFQGRPLGRSIALFPPEVPKIVGAERPLTAASDTDATNKGQILEFIKIGPFNPMDQPFGSGHRTTNNFPINP